MAAECVSAKNTQCRISCLAVYTDCHYKQALKCRTQDHVNDKVNRMMRGKRGGRGGRPRGRPPKRVAIQIKEEPLDYEEDDEIDDEEFESKVKIEVLPLEKKRRIDNYHLSSEGEYDETEEIDNQVEVFTGYEALKRMGLAKEEAAEFEQEKEGSVRRNRGKVPKRFMD